jgi:hypothetical protein
MHDAQSGVVGRVRAVVLPPGHGKTFRHGSGALREADALCDPKSHPTLVSLKGSAKAGEVPWSVYVAEWSRRLAAAAEDGTVVMVPDVDVAVAAGFRLVGVFLLERSVWLSNLAGRPTRKLGQWQQCYDSVSASGVAVVCASNEDLTRALSACCVASEPSPPCALCVAASG